MDPRETLELMLETCRKKIEENNMKLATANRDQAILAGYLMAVKEALAAITGNEQEDDAGS